VHYLLSIIGFTLHIDICIKYRSRFGGLARPVRQILRRPSSSRVAVLWRLLPSWLSRYMYTEAPERLERGGGLLTVETEANGDSKSTNERVLRAGTSGFCPALAALVGPVQNLFFSLYTTVFRFICPHRLVSWAGSRAGSPVS
jgi:hypothetical protein